MPKIVISYRRADSAGITGRIFDRLVAHFGATSVFMDVDSIPLGVDFRDHVRDVLIQSDALLVIVGPTWLAKAIGAPAPRLHEDADPVRVELETAIERGIPLIPVLVEGAKMPEAAMLPASLKAFAFRNAAEVASGRDFSQHIDRLIRSLDRLFAEIAAKTARATEAQSAGAARRPPDMPRSAGRMRALAVAAVVIGVVAAIGTVVATRYWSRGTAVVVPKIAPASDVATTASSKTSWTFDELRRFLENARSQLGALDVTLLWSTTDDLDLAIACPGGAQIKFTQPRGCNGYLDLDANSGASQTINPIEHVLWTSRRPPAGEYQVIVTLYKRRTEATIPFTIVFADSGAFGTEQQISVLTGQFKADDVGSSKSFFTFHVPP